MKLCWRLIPHPSLAEACGKTRVRGLRGYIHPFRPKQTLVNQVDWKVAVAAFQFHTTQFS